MPHTQEVRASLGCGTLILIAIIVIIFSGHKDHDNLENRIEELTREVSRLRQDIHQLRNDSRPPATRPGPAEE
ncbi:MAG: hypothetical protein GWO24_11875 [Akkermansiaceae bacterium]|nr:hypothetical protein [Akkermansiaceae bacterium]